MSPLTTRKGCGPEQGQRSGDAAGGFERSGRFRRVGDLQAESVAIAERRFDLLAEMSMVDHHLAPAGGSQTFEVPGDQRLAAGAQQRLRRVVGERPQPFTAAGREDHRFHQKV
jgi:hypothetical protein